jgi:transposase InsO family protein
MRQGHSLHEAARWLGISVRTLRRWARRTGQVVPRGRPVYRSPLALRQEVIAQLVEWGPAAGVPALRAAFPMMSRAELTDLLRRFRRVHRRRRGRRLARLEWKRVGAVWSADFAHPPQPIEGRFPRLLAVRDLASGYQLAFAPVPDETGETAAALLSRLFTEHGPPLVLKLDNGSAFRCEQLQSLLERHGVLVLHSPVRTPQYNGSIEASVGVAKGRAEFRAERFGEPGVWTWEDVEGARLEGNVFGRSPIDRRCNPDQVWHSREPLRAGEREALATTVRRLEASVREGLSAEEQSDSGLIERMIMRRALGALGLLVIRWGRISPAISAPEGDNIM